MDDFPGELLHCCIWKESSGNHFLLYLQLALYFQGFIMMIQGSFRIKMWTLTPDFPKANLKISTLVTEPVPPLWAQSTKGQVYDRVVSAWVMKTMDAFQSLRFEEFVQLFQDLRALIYLTFSFCLLFDSKTLFVLVRSTSLEITEVTAWAFFCPEKKKVHVESMSLPISGLESIRE